MKGWDAARAKNTFVQIPQPSQKQCAQLKGRTLQIECILSSQNKTESNNKSLRRDVTFNIKVFFNTCIV